MKTERNILIAFILNFAFSIFEFLGGIYTGSISIMSDAIHDIGDATSIGLSFFLEKISKKQPDNNYTYGYMRYSVLGSTLTTLILLIGSLSVIFNGINRIIHPTNINYEGMIIFAVIGVCVNFCATFFTRDGASLNQKAVNLHMLEDVLGWIVVLIGAIVIKFTNFILIDPIMSIGVAIFILINATKNIKEILNIFLEKTPLNIDIEEIKEHIKNIEKVIDVHHIHIWSIDGQNNYATMHVITNDNNQEIKHKIKEELSEHGICHATLEIESENECCHNKNCHIDFKGKAGHHHHHHH